MVTRYALIFWVDFTIFVKNPLLEASLPKASQ